MTDGFSGSDIATLCKDAIMSPIWKCQSATKYKEITIGGVKKLTPTYSSDPTGIDMTLYTMPDPTLL
jgi:SpoVK/Ycf46/Vps4 family AAA+-type ATPase